MAVSVHDSDSSPKKRCDFLDEGSKAKGGEAGRGGGEVRRWRAREKWGWGGGRKGGEGEDVVCGEVEGDGGS